MKKMLKSNVKFISGFLLGLVMAGAIGVYAFTISSSEVSYDNSTSGLEANNVKDALDSLYASSGGNISFVRVTSSTTSVDCGFRPKMVIIGKGANINYPEVVAIDFENEKAVAAYHSPSGNGALIYNDAQSNAFTSLSSGYTLNDTGFTTSAALDGGATYGVYVWCIK